jgi:hypothetical protein
LDDPRVDEASYDLQVPQHDTMQKQLSNESNQTTHSYTSLGLVDQQASDSGNSPSDSLDADTRSASKAEVRDTPRIKPCANKRSKQLKANYYSCNSSAPPSPKPRSAACLPHAPELQPADGITEAAGLVDRDPESEASEGDV